MSADETHVFEAVAALEHLGRPAGSAEIAATGQPD
jgi:hypothetical protein